MDRSYRLRRRLQRLSALGTGAVLLAWIAVRRSPWDLSLLDRRGESAAIVIDLWGWEFGAPTWLWRAAALALAFGLVTTVVRAAGRIGRIEGATATVGCALFLFSIWPTEQSREVVTAVTLGGLGLGLVSYGLLGVVPHGVERVLRLQSRARRRWSELPIASLLTVAFSFVFVVAHLGSYGLFGHSPHIVDETAQLFHAGIFLDGHLSVPAPALPESFSFVHMILTDRWYSQYPPGHTFFLALGLLARAPWSVGPLFGALSVVLIYFIGREAYDEATGRLALLPAALSPFLLLMSSSFMNHTSALFFLEVFLLGAIRMVRRSGPLDGLLMGLGLGVALTIRSMTAAAIAFPFGVYLVLRWCILLRRGGRSQARRLLVSGLVALLVLAFFVACMSVFNLETNGDPALSGYEALHGKNALPGFGNSGWWDRPHTPWLGLQATLRNLNALNQHLLGLPLPGLLFLGCGLGFLRWKVWDGLFLASAVSLTLAYFVYWYQDLALGPRFLYEALAPLILLSARALQVLPRLAAAIACPAQARQLSAGLWLALTLGYGYSICVGAPSLAAYYSRNYADGNREVARVAAEVRDEPALVFVPHALYPSVFALNDPHLARGAIYAKDLGPTQNRRLIASHPGYRAYRLLALGRYERVAWDGGNGFPAEAIYPVVPDRGATVEASTVQMSYLNLNAGSWRDQRTYDFGGGWKNHDHLRVDSKQPGAETGFLFRVQRPESRTIRLALSHGPDFGVVEVQVDRESVALVDLYAERLEPRVHTIDGVRLGPGVIGVLIRVTGRNAASAGFGMGLDYVTLDPVPHSGIRSEDSGDQPGAEEPE